MDIKPAHHAIEGFTPTENETYCIRKTAVYIVSTFHGFTSQCCNWLGGQNRVCCLADEVAGALSASAASQEPHAGRSQQSVAPCEL